MVWSRAYMQPGLVLAGCHLPHKAADMSSLLPFLATTHCPWSRETRCALCLPTHPDVFSPWTPSAQPSYHQHPLSTQRHLAAPTLFWGSLKLPCVDTQCRAISAHSSGPVIGEGQFRGSQSFPKPHPRDGHMQVCSVFSPQIWRRVHYPSPPVKVKAFSSLSLPPSTYLDTG